MAKKRNIRHQHIQIPGGTSRFQTTSPPSTKSVNERLEQLRREQAPRATLQQREDVLSVATSRTIPQSLRQILQLPETAPPIPRRARRTMGNRRTVGPPPPPSWLENSRHAPAHIRRNAKEKQRLWLEQSSLRRRPTRMNKLAILEAGSQNLPKEGTLAHLALKSMAVNWSFLREYEKHNIPTLPIRLKSCLVTYLGLYGPEDAMDLGALRWLFSEDIGSYNEDLIRLDLTGLFWEEFTILDVSKFFLSPRSNRTSLEKCFSNLQIKNNGKAPAENIVEEGNVPLSPLPRADDEGVEDESTWEDEVDNEVALLPLKMPVAMSFPNLTHLSLANAGNYASWAQLLEISTHLAKITHLSLANWPTPSLTPNSKTAFIHERHHDIAVGGSHLYSAMDSDWHEAANILRRLSHKTYGLKWLDLEGCNEWLPALVWQETSATTLRWTNRPASFGQTDSSARSAELQAESAFWEARNRSESSQGADWNGSWGQVVYVNVSQGVMPKDAASVQRLPSGFIACELLSYLRDLEECNEEGEDADRNPQFQDIDVYQWLEREKEARSVRSAVRQIRLNERGPYCEFDHGWKAKAFTQRRVQAAGNVFPQ